MRLGSQNDSLVKRSLRRLILLAALPGFTVSQTPSPTPSAQGSEPDLKTVLSQMDEASKSFKSAQADVELVQYTKLVDETSTQSGEVFFRRHGNDLDVALRVLKPHPKQVVVKDGRLYYYDPKTGQMTERDVRSNRSDVETMMNLGFGGRGQELVKDFDVKLIAWEVVDNVNTAKLELAPKSDRLKQFFTKITLWIDPRRDVPLKQQRFESSGDYQLTHYTNIKAPAKVSDDVFRIKKTGATE